MEVQFATFKPACVALLKEPSLANLVKVRKLLESAPSNVVQDLQEFVLFPLFILLSNTEIRTEKIVREISISIGLICQKSTIRVYKIFSDLLLQLLLLVYSINPEKGKHQLESEEIKLTALETIRHVINATTDELMTELISGLSSRPLLGHLVFTLLRVAANEEMKELRLTALNCFSDLLLRPIDEDLLSKSIKEFLPGVSTHLMKIVNGEVKQPHSITRAAVRLLSQILKLVINDRLFPEDATVVSADRDWLNRTRPHLHALLEKILKNADLHHWVELELVTMTRDLILTCSGTLQPSLALLVKKLVQLTVHETAQVAQEAQVAVDTITQARIDLDSPVRQNLFDIATSLPGVIAQTNSRQQLVILQELQGHLTLTGKGLERSLKFSGLRERLFKGLLAAAALEPAKVVERERGTDLFQLRHLRNERIVDTLVACCASIGRHGRLSETLDYFMDVLRRRDAYYDEAIYVMMHLFAGAGEEKEVLSAVVREYAATLSTLGDSGDVLTGQLLLQAIGAAAAAMGHDFEPLLLPTLRPLLEKMGDDRWTSSAALALQTVAGALQLASVAQLVEQNVDYFAPQINFQLRNIVRYPRAIDLLRALLMVADLGVDQWLQHIVHQALRGLDLCFSSSLSVLPYVQVLELYCMAASRRNRPETIETQPFPAEGDTLNDSHQDDIAMKEAFLQKCRDYRRHYVESRTFDNDQDVPADSTQDQCQEEEDFVDPPVKNPPKEVVLLSSILERCAQLLPQSNDERLDTALLHTIGLSVALLSAHEDVLLPKVHRLWDPLRHQLLQSRSPLKQRQAFDVVALLVRQCPDFLRQRFLAVYGDLLAMAKSTRTPAKSHVFSQSFKLQKRLLQQLATLATLVDAPILDASRTLYVLSLYLSDRQLPELQVLAKEGFETMVRHRQYTGAVWLTLHSLIAERTINCPGFPSVQVGVRAEKNEFQFNAQHLIEKLFVSRHANRT